MKISHDTLYVNACNCIEVIYGDKKPSDSVLKYFERKGNQLEMFIC